MFVHHLFFPLFLEYLQKVIGINPINRITRSIDLGMFKACDKYFLSFSL